MAVSLPEDVLREILERVLDVATLFRCATVCKGWRRLFVDDHSFVSRCMPVDVCRSSPFPGFFAQLWCGQREALAPCLVPAPRTVFGSRRRFLDSFIPKLDDIGFFDNAVPLVSRHGLLLVRIDLYRTRVHQHPSGGDVLCVCNLLAGTFDMLPPLEGDYTIHQFDMTGYALVTAADFPSSTNKHQQQRSSFKVLVLGTRMSKLQYRLRTFSSTGEHRWSMCSGSLKRNNIHELFQQHDAIVCGGVARWLFSATEVFHTFDVSIETGHVSFTDLKLPMRFNRCIIEHCYDEPYLSVDILGRLLFLCVNDGIRLEIWAQHNKGTWTNTQTLMLELARTYGFPYTCLGEKNGTVVLKDRHDHVYVIDVKTRDMLEVTDWPGRSSISRKKIVPLEMDWPAFFTSRLGVGM